MKFSKWSLIICTFFLILTISCNFSTSKKDGNKSEKLNNSLSESSKENSKYNSDTSHISSSIGENQTFSGTEKLENEQSAESDLNEFPKGFVVKDKTTLFSAADIHSMKKGELNIGAEVFLIETLLGEENGETSAYPTWFQIETKSGIIGWVKSSHVSFGH